jgi:hypothetical protein
MSKKPPLKLSLAAARWLLFGFGLPNARKGNGNAGACCECCREGFTSMLNSKLSMQAYARASAFHEYIGRWEGDIPDDKENEISKLQQFP